MTYWRDWIGILFPRLWYLVRNTNWYAKQSDILETMNLYILSNVYDTSQNYLLIWETVWHIGENEFVYSFHVYDTIRISNWYAKRCDILEALNLNILSNGYDTSLNYQLIFEAVWHIGDIEFVYYFHVYDTSQNYQLICETVWHIGDNECLYSFHVYDTSQN